MLIPFSLDEWFKRGKPKVINQEGITATLMMEPYGLFEDGTPYGPIKIAIPGHRFSVIGNGIIRGYFIVEDDLDNSN